MAHVVHLTVLNPALHTRIFGKLARSQQQLGHQVTIIGQDAATEAYQTEGIRILPVAPFGRGLRARMRGWAAIARHMRHTEADLWVIHTPELLWAGLWQTWIRRRGVVYDVHEDYAANLQAAGHPLLARVFRAVERLVARQFRAVCYAEACYHNILQTLDNQTFTLPNAFTTPATTPPLPDGLTAGQYWLYTGTLAPAWGLFEAIAVWEKTFSLHRMPLVVAGHTQTAATLAALTAAARQDPQLRLVGGSTYVPHALIVTLIRNCYAGFGLYHPLPHLRDKIPTKFFEFAALGRPLIYRSSPAWNTWGERHHLGVAWQPDMSPETLIREVQHWAPAANNEDCFWTAYTGTVAEVLSASLT